MHRVTSIVDAAPYRLFRSRRSPAHSGTAATRSRRAAECPYHPAGGDVQPVARRVRGLEADVEAVHAKGQLNRVQLGGPVGGGKKAGREGGGAQQPRVQPCPLVGRASGAGRLDAALPATRTAASTKRGPALYRPGRDTSSHSSIPRLAGSSSGGTWSHWTLVELQVQQAVPRP